MSMKVLTVPVTPFQQNCSLLICEQTGRAAVVDPGGELDRIVAAAEQAGVVVEKILVTHAHIDHAGGVAELAAELGVPVEGPHRDDQFWIDLLAEQSQRFGFPPAQAFTPNRWLDDGDTVRVGQLSLHVIHCPGHTPGHVVFYQPQVFMYGLRCGGFAAAKAECVAAGRDGPRSSERGSLFLASVLRRRLGLPSRRRQRRH